MKLKEDEFLDYSTQFIGYGPVTAPIWLVGMEAGGGKSIEEVQKRIMVWDARGRKETEDLQSYHQALEMPDCNWKIHEQKTWAPLIRILFAIEGRDPGPGDVLQFQIDHFGKTEGSYGVFDVSQVSCRKEKDWILGPTGIS